MFDEPIFLSYPNNNKNNNNNKGKVKKYIVISLEISLFSIHSYINRTKIGCSEINYKYMF
jgi:hypothetical protein